jgi:light-regulated signal transduction histidine kinase (bacteriophytochrome)
LDGLKADLVANSAEVTHGALPTVVGDPMQLAVLFQNLIGNAIKYRSEAQPKIHISAVAEHECWKFSVRDNGIGIAPADTDRIFGLFQRGHSNHPARGAGIGLATCKKIAELHGGRMWVESAPGRGSTFYFTIATRYESLRVISSAGKEKDQERKATA